MTQLTLDLPHRRALDRERFLVSASNRDAVAWIDAWPEWPNGYLALTGPASSGKSHLAAVWQAASRADRLPPDALAQLENPASFAGRSALLAEDIDHALAQAPDRGRCEESLLHLINLVRQQGSSLLLTARQAPARLVVALPDLSSRLRALQVAQLGAPDDALLAALLEKHFADRQLRVAPQVTRYVVQRIERSAQAVQEIAARLDQEALAQRKPITLPLARQVLGES